MATSGDTHSRGTCKSGKANPSLEVASDARLLVLPSLRVSSNLSQNAAFLKLALDLRLGWRVGRVPTYDVLLLLVSAAADDDDCQQKSQIEHTGETAICEQAISALKLGEL